MNIILQYLMISLAVVIVMTVMGFTKAYTSYKLGDIAIKNMGKVSLNPKKHFEILGFFMFLFFQYGWTAPMETSSLHYKNRKTGNILVCIIPLILAIIYAFISVLLGAILMKLPIAQSNLFSFFFNYLGVLFVNFAVFNILPIYPLFGQKLFQTILPVNKAIKLSQYDKIIQLAVIFLLLSGILRIFLDFIATPISITLYSITKGIVS